MALALVGALFIGISLGLLGSGGSILTLPVLVFILDRPEKIAVAESLAIVGSVSLAGSLSYAFSKGINWKSVLFFGLPGMGGASAGACASYYISGAAQLTLFAFTMLVVSGLLLAGPISYEQAASGKSSNGMTILKGFLVGCLTGLIGIGGGFLIVPALVILCSLSMSAAVGTSLVIIAMNAWTGFIGQLVILHDLNLHVGWHLIGIISAIAILGCLAGSFFSKRIPQMRLRQILGCCILAMGIGVLFVQLKSF